MTEQDKTTSMIIKSETEEMESKDKDKDKLKNDDLKSLFNVVVNNYNENIKDSDSSKKKSSSPSYRKISFKKYFEQMKQRYKSNTKEKESILNQDISNEDLLTIINSSKIHNSLPHFVFSREKRQFQKKEKR